MINRKIRKNTGFERISGRPVRASSPIFGLDVLRFEVNRVFLLEKPNKDAVIPKEYANFDIQDLKYWIQDTCEKTGWQYKETVADFSTIAMIFKNDIGENTMCVDFKVYLTSSSWEEICNVFNTLFR